MGIDDARRQRKKISDRMAQEATSWLYTERLGAATYRPAARLKIEPTKPVHTDQPCHALPLASNLP